MHASERPSQLLHDAAASHRPWIYFAFTRALGLGILLSCASPTLAAQASKDQHRPAHRPSNAALHSVVQQLSKALADQDAKALTRLFSKDAEVRIGSRPLSDGPAGLFKALEQPPLSETTPFHVVQKSGRILGPGLAIVYGELVQYGSVIVRRALPVQLFLQQTGSEWRIVSFWLPDPSYFPPPQR